jgi:Ca2+-binding RTX toxin-like protein
MIRSINMAKVTIKGKKVNGTKKKDSIIWKSSNAKYKSISVFANNGNDIINFKKSKYKNKLYGQNGNDIIYGGKKNDTIDGGKGNDKLYGYDGNDNIKGGVGNDSIYGGKGNDKINGGKGNNTIYFKKNEGTDTILNGGGTDTLVFSDEKDFRNLVFSYNGNNLNISASGTKVILKDFKKGHSVKYIKVGDKIIDLPKNIIFTTDADENLYMYEGTDSQFIYATRSGEQYIGAGFGNDTIFASQNSFNYIIGRPGDDVIIGTDKSPYPYEFNRYYGDDGNDTIYVGKSGGAVNTGNGDDVIYTPNINDLSVITNILLTGQDGSDTIYRRGNTTNRLYFNNDYYENISLVRVKGNNDLLIKYNDNNSSVCIKDYFKSGNGAMATSFFISTQSSSDLIDLKTVISDKGISVIDKYIIGTDKKDKLYAGTTNSWVEGLADNDTIYGQAGNNTLVGGEGEDIIYGGSGNNSIYSGSGNDTIYSGTGNNIINSGSGNDYIDVQKGTNTIVYDYINYTKKDKIVNFKETDTLYFPNNTASDFDRIVFDYEDADCLDIGNYGIHVLIYDYSNTSRNGYIKFGNDAPIKLSTFLASKYMYVYGNEANTIANTSMGGAVYTRGGNDTITNVSYGNNHIFQLNAGDGDDSITGLGSYSRVGGGNGNDIITTNGYVTECYLNGNDGDDIIIMQYGSSNSNMYGGKGNDYLEGGYEMVGEEGNDIIKSYSSGQTYINPGNGNDELYRHESNTSLISYTLSTYITGNKTLYDNLGGKSILYFDGLYSDSAREEFYDSIRYYKDGNDLIINYKDRYSSSYENNTITVKDFLISTNQNNLCYKKGSSEITVLSEIDKNGYCGQVITGDGELYGTVYNDTITAGDGDNFIYAGRGDDEIHAGAGDNTIAFYNNYYFDGNSNNYDTANDGNDIVYTNGGGDDTLDFGQSIAVKYEKSDNDLIIKYNFDPASSWGAKSTVTLKDFYDSTVNNSTQYIKLLGQDAIELKPDELTQDAITTHNGSILCSSNSSDMRFDDNNNYRTAIGSNGDNIITVDTTASETYYLDGKLGNDVYSIDSLDPKVIIYDSDNIGKDNIGKVYVLTGSFTTNNNIFCDMQVTVEDGDVTACNYNSLNIYRTGKFDQGVRVMASPNLAGVTDGTPVQSLSRVDDGENSKMLTDISGLAQATASWIAAHKETGVYSTAKLISEGGDDAAAILAIANTYWHSYQ